MLEVEYDFAKKFKFAVEVYHETLGSFGNATLVFGKYGMASLKFGFHGASKNTARGKNYAVLKARTGDRKTFTLFECRCFDFVCEAYYLVMGDVRGEFRSIQVRYSDFSEWFMHWQSIEGEVGKELVWKDVPSQISVHVKTDDEEFSVKTKTEWMRKEMGEDLLINEHIVFEFENIASTFRAEDIKNKSHEISNLFSILLAQPLSVVSIWVKEDDGRWCPAFFPTFKRVKKDSSRNDFYIRCLASRSMLDGKWQTVIESYYKSEYRKISWVWLAGLQRYKGFWQYKVLGYVSVLDKYVSQFSEDESVAKKLPAKGMRKLTAGLKKLSGQLSDAQQKEVLQLVENSFAGKRDLEFEEEYEFTTGKSDSDIIQIINISTDDFDHIKKVRNKIAHGDAITTITNDLTRESGIVDKIALLLTYWAYRDFGLTKDDFLHCLSHNHNRLSLNPTLDRVHFEKITKKSGFYSVSKKEFERISKMKKNKIAFFFTVGWRGRISYSKDYMKAYEAYTKARAGKSGLLSIADAIGVSQDSLKYWPKAYFECGDKRLDLDSCYFVSGVK